MEVESDFFRGGVFGSNEKDVINAYRLRRKLNSNVFKIAGTLKSYSDHKKMKQKSPLLAQSTLKTG